MSPKEKLALHHRSAHELLRKRLLSAAEGTMRSLVQYAISVDEARTELKDSLQSFEEVLVREMRGFVIRCFVALVLPHFHICLLA